MIIVYILKTCSTAHEVHVVTRASTTSEYAVTFRGFEKLDGWVHRVLRIYRLDRRYEVRDVQTMTPARFAEYFRSNKH